MAHRVITSNKQESKRTGSLSSQVPQNLSSFSNYLTCIGITYHPHGYAYTHLEAHVYDGKKTLDHCF